MRLYLTDFRSLGDFGSLCCFNFSSTALITLLTALLIFDASGRLPCAMLECPPPRELRERSVSTLQLGGAMGKVVSCSPFKHSSIGIQKSLFGDLLDPPLNLAFDALRYFPAARVRVEHPRSLAWHIALLSETDRRALPSASEFPDEGRKKIQSSGRNLIDSVPAP